MITGAGLRQLSASCSYPPAAVNRARRLTARGS
jgi:hypothetical protein